ncbi:MAG: glycosyltransferase family 2 protein [Eubacterium sp.]|nr:glycosyltransferase family 2 protein [Eubacterium sp.]
MITIIVPVYKTEQYLRRCVDSIIEQSYTNIEILLVDDGSPDSCPKICDEYASKDKRIIVLHKENGGLSSARNAGLDNCHGKYVAFVDSDDFVHQRYIEFLFQAVKLSNSEMSMCDLEYTYLRNDKMKKRTVMFSNDIMSDKEAALGYLKNDGQKYICPCNKLYSIDLFDNLRFPIGKLSEDAYVQYKFFFL